MMASTRNRRTATESAPSTTPPTAARRYEISSSPLARSLRPSAHGVWSDGDTIWVAHETDGKLYAYDLATGAASADDDITPHTAYTDVNGGLWGDATRVWTVTANQIQPGLPAEVAFVPYRISGGAFVPSDLVGTNGNMRPSRYHQPGVDRAPLPEAEAFFRDGSTFWAAGAGRDTLFAYDTSRGDRDYSKDIVVPDSVCDHDEVVGIWHDSSRSLLYLATQCSTKKLFALDLSGGPQHAHHIPVHDITMPAAARHDHRLLVRRRRCLGQLQRQRGHYQGQPARLPAPQQPPVFRLVLTAWRGVGHGGRRLHHADEGHGDSDPQRAKRRPRQLSIPGDDEQRELGNDLVAGNGRLDDGRLPSCPG